MQARQRSKERTTHAACLRSLLVPVVPIGVPTNAPSSGPTGETFQVVGATIW